ncbi:Predicted pyrophosphatase or phosphodiesterase, AlkP superfamily [Chitinophaga costaii]|uniref:Predicted pyrophosphatase or phosphodiesterase, AlkP superfamily n=2 Tax=Chitinophaga costaii TaxID=1335309 RepID=A0A1C3ZRD8_9BACT|nr:Predicted pyrophosphatase or phosphodiesterase, AlkP superfamily [Chitinophaga costaii]
MALLVMSSAFAQNPAVVKTSSTVAVARPKLVIGIVVDQMRWDYLYRFANRYSQGGFRRLTGQGFSCENTLINYTPTITACGHSCVYTGSVPAIHGIVGNTWYDTALNRKMYCAEDSTVSGVGSNNKAGKMSPRNLLVTTIGDELRLANKESKVIGVALKDRGAIMPAGHMAQAAYWYDPGAGKWISSTYYMNELPAWVNQFNDQKYPEQYLKQPWTTLYPLESYTLSTEDDKPYEGRFPNTVNSSFPHTFKTPLANIASTPYGNTMTLEFAKQALVNYQLGKGKVTDLLTVSLSATDYVGHQFGPNSIEAEDTYLRLDKDLGDFFNYLDATLGKGNYLLFLTADHGVAHVPGFLAENNIPAGSWSDKDLSVKINSLVQAAFGIKDVVVSTDNYQFWLNHAAIQQAGKNEKEVIDFITASLKRMPPIADALNLHELGSEALLEPMRTMVINGYNKKRGGDIQLIPQPGWVNGGITGTTHGIWNPYDAHIPLVFMGWGIHPGHTNRLVGMTDIAPTIAALLHVQMPSGNIGKVVEEITK